MPSTPLFISTFPRLIVALLAVASVAAAPATRPAKSRPTTRGTTTAPAATQPAATSPASTTTTAPAPAPRAVALALTAAIEKGDLATARGLIVADEPSQKLLAGTIQFARALARLDAAAVARFGEPGHAVSQNLLRLGESARALEGATQSIDADGDTAVLYSAATGTALVNLRKVDGQWRVILDSPPQGLERTLDLYRRVEQLAQRMVAEISSGIYGSPEEAAEAFSKGLWRARIEAQ